MQRSLRTNIAANVIGRMYTGIAGVLLVPVYLHFLGVESYGLFALLNSYMAIAGLLDLGFSAAITREIAKLSATSPDRMRDMVWTISIPYCALALLVGFGIYFGAPWIAAVAISKNTGMSDPAVIRAVGLAGFSLTLQLPVFLFTGGLAGLQRQDISNVLTVVSTTLRHGAVLILLFGLSNSVATFMGWQAAVAALTAVAAFAVLWRQMPSNHRRPQFRPELLRATWRFAAGVGGIVILATVVSQSDKVVVGALLPLSDVGHYMIASVIASNLLLISQPVAAVAFPRLSQLIAARDAAGVQATLQKLCQLVALMILPLTTAIAAFPEQTVMVWTGSADVAHGVAPLIRLLAVGVALNACATIPYALLLSAGRNWLLLIASAIAFVIILPLVYFLTRHFGSVGAASAMTFCFAQSFLVIAAMLHPLIGKSEWQRWFGMSVVLPQALIAAVVLAAAAIAPQVETRLKVLIFLAVTWLISAGAAGLAMPWTRQLVYGYVQMLAARLFNKRVRYSVGTD